MKCGLSNKRDHDLRTHPNLFKDLIGSFERTELKRWSGIWDWLLSICKLESESGCKRD